LPSETLPSAKATPEPALAKGASLGRYVLLDPLGQGAMGIVYRAFDPELDRRIAVKVLRRAPAFASGQQERLLREGKAMARLSHPNVVAVYDVGTYGERVFVAMELVDGVTLRSWLSSDRSWAQVIAMFVQAGRGLAAAHAAGLVHRDFKPDNALVGSDDRVRVVDFGLAWAPETLEAPPADDSDHAYRGPFSTRSSSHTSTGAAGSMVGTPRYSPPEQIDGKRVDASADQFAFCASLWEALYEKPPFEGDDVLTLLGNVREGKLTRDPPPAGVPSAVIDALQRGLSAEPAERFPSMDALLQVLVHDPTPRRRRWIGASVAAAVALAGIALAVGAHSRESQSVCQGAEAKFAGVWDPERKEAVRQALLASGKPWAGQTADLLSGEIDRYGRDWVSMHREACEATSVRHEQSGTLLDLRMQCLDERASEVRALASMLSQPGDTLLATAPKAVYSLTALRGCADTHALLSPVPIPSDPATRSGVEQVRVALATVKALNDLGRYTEASQLADELTTRGQSLRYSPIEAEALEAWGDALERLDEYPRAVEAYRHALWAAERGLDHARAASAMINLVWAVGVDQGLHEQAHEYASHAAAVLAGLGGDAVLEANLASHEGSVFRNEGRFAEAERSTREAVDKRKIAFGPMHPRYAMALSNLAACVADEGRYAETLELAQEALAINARTLGEHHPDYGLSLQAVASSLKLLGRYSEARPLAEQALTVTREAYGPEHARVASVEWALALIEMKVGDDASAEQHMRHALAIAERVNGPSHANVGEYASVLADVLVKEGRYADAVPLYRRALAIAGNNGQDAAEVQAGLGVALLGLGRPADAVVVLEAALQWQETNPDTPRYLAQARFGVARALWATGGDRARARALVAAAIQTFSTDPGAQDELREATAWLDGLPGATGAAHP
jgi:eukaryotic-like serine/threonine-protein kinase